MNRQGRVVRFNFGRLSLSLSLSLSLLILQSASAENLISRPVGFLRVVVPSNALALASQPFVALAETNAEPILRWNASSGYTSSTAAAETGEGFWLINPGSTNRSVFLAGEVVLSPSNTALLCPGLNLVGYPYSGPRPLNETALGSLTNSVEILSAAAQSPEADEDVLGKGYWVKSLSEECVVWTEVRPYENLFPASGLPEITAITTENGNFVTLSIACEGGELFDVFYQDICPTSRFDTARNWHVAKAGLSVSGRTSIEWRDAGSGDRAAPSEILGRYYLIGRADIDLNGNGIPDAREQFVYGTDLATGTAAAGCLSTGAALVEGPEGSLPTSFASDAEKDTLTNSEPIQVVGVGHIIYVDRKRGNDAFTGRAALVASGDGPKKTIRSGLNAAQSGDVMVIREGVYQEDLNVAGRDITAVIDGTVDLTGPKIVIKHSAWTNRDSSLPGYTNVPGSDAGSL